MAEPRWLNRLMVDTIHSELLLEHGGAPGIRDGGEDLLADLAAAYLFGLAKNHGYVDCNMAFAGHVHSGAHSDRLHAARDGGPRRGDGQRTARRRCSKGSHHRRRGPVGAAVCARYGFLTT